MSVVIISRDLSISLSRLCLFVRTGRVVRRSFWLGLEVIGDFDLSSFKVKVGAIVIVVARAGASFLPVASVEKKIRMEIIIGFVIMKGRKLTVRDL